MLKNFERSCYKKTKAIPKIRSLTIELLPIKGYSLLLNSLGGRKPPIHVAQSKVRWSLIAVLISKKQV